MLELIINKVLARINDLPAEVMQQVRDALSIELNQYDIIPKTTDLVVYTGAPQLLKLFIASKKVDGASPKTLKNYYRELNLFFARLQKEVTKVTTNDIRMYLATRENEGVQRSTLSTLLSTLKSFYSWAENSDLIVKSPCRPIKAFKVPKRVRKPLSPEDHEKVRLACKTLRDRAIIEVFYSTGCRLDEIYKLNRTDIDWSSGAVMVIGKGDKERKVSLTPKAKVHLKKYLESRSDMDPALFVSERNPHQRLGHRMIEEVFSRLGKDSGISLPLFPHRMRHTTGTNMLHNGAPLHYVQRYLGHTSPETTEIYAEIDQHDVQEAAIKFVA
jgi:integrase/recombinase XerD